MSRLRPALAALAGLAVCAFAACSGGRDHAPPPAGFGAGGSGTGNAGSSGSSGGGFVDDGGDANLDAACGYKVVSTLARANVYMVVDKSGSMAEVVGGKVKYDSLRVSLVKLSRLIGPRARMGIALFPGVGCNAGDETLALLDGDDASYIAKDTYGPTSTLIANALNQGPNGGTPTASTLVKLTPTILGFGKNTFVLLATDGGPNCNKKLACGVSTCIPNLENVQGCTPTYNCCDPKNGPEFSTEGCLDVDASKAAVAALGKAGVKVIVVGIPGSEAYASLLDDLAVEGGAPKSGGAHKYWDVTDLDALDALFEQIAQKVIVSCEIALEKKPEDPGLVNLYFDGLVVPYDATSGWQYKDEATIQIVGAACDQLQSGTVAKAEVFVGCPTTTPKG